MENSNFNIPQVSLPIINPQTGMIDPAWFNFFLNVYQSSQSSSSTATFSSSTVAAANAVALTAGTAANVTSLTLPAGDWDLAGVVDFASAGASITLFEGGCSLQSGVLPAQPGGSGLGTDPLASSPFASSLINGVYTQVLPTVRLNITKQTTVYLVASAQFSMGAVSAYGTIRARKMA